MTFEAQRRALGHARSYRAVNTLLLHCTGKPFNDLRLVVAVHCENSTEHIHVLCEQNVGVWSLKAVVITSVLKELSAMSATQ